MVWRTRKRMKRKYYWDNRDSRLTTKWRVRRTSWWVWVWMWMWMWMKMTLNNCLWSSRSWVLVKLWRRSSWGCNMESPLILVRSDPRECWNWLWSTWSASGDWLKWTTSSFRISWGLFGKTCWSSISRTSSLWKCMKRTPALHWNVMT